VILDEERLNNNFSLEESNYDTVVLKCKGQEIVCLKYCANSNSIGNDSMFPVLNLIRKYKEEYECN